MKLDLEPILSRPSDEIHVSASLRNTGTEAVTVLLEPYMSKTILQLKDERGNLLEARDSRAMQGGPGHGIGSIAVRVLQPGDAVEVDWFTLESSLNRAQAPDRSWDLKDVRSGTLTLEMAYEVTEEAAREAAACRAPQVAVGTWSTKPIPLPFRNG